MMTKIIGYDMTGNANAPTAVCVDCLSDADGTPPPIYAGEEWGGSRCDCAQCGAPIDVTLVARLRQPPMQP